MGFFDTLLGGSTQESRQQQRFGVPQQEAAFGAFFPEVMRLQQQFAGDPSQLIAPFTPAQQVGQALGIQGAFGAIPQIQQAQQALGQQLNAADIAGSPVFSAALQGAINPLVRTFQQDVLPGIRSQAVGVGQPGGSREGIAQGLAAQGLGEQISDLAARTAQQAFQTGIGARGQALGLAPSIAGLGQLPSQILQGIGGQQQALEQARLGAPVNFLQQIRGLLGQPIILGESFSRGQTQRGLTEGFADIFCSKSFKEDFQEIDTQEILEKLDQLDVEKWNYKGEEEKHIGPYAEDFKELFGVGNGKTINVVDALGVLLAAVKAQSQQIKELKDGLTG